MGGANQGERGERGVRWPKCGYSQNEGARRQKILIVAFLLVSGAANPALALTDRDILGKWCGSETNYDIGQKTLTVTWKSDKQRKKFVINGFKFSEADVIMHWRRGARDRVLSTQFGEFSADRKVMVQVKSEGGPRREFRRC